VIQSLILIGPISKTHFIFLNQILSCLPAALLPNSHLININHTQLARAIVREGPTNIQPHSWNSHVCSNVAGMHWAPISQASSWEVFFFLYQESLFFWYLKKIKFFN